MFSFFDMADPATEYHHMLRLSMLYQLPVMVWSGGESSDQGTS